MRPKTHVLSANVGGSRSVASNAIYIFSQQRKTEDGKEKEEVKSKKGKGKRKKTDPPSPRATKGGGQKKDPASLKLRRASDGRTENNELRTQNTE
jgi:hypothetical protein